MMIAEVDCSGSSSGAAVIRLAIVLFGAALLETGGNALLREGMLRQWWPLLLAGFGSLDVENWLS